MTQAQTPYQTKGVLYKAFWEFVSFWGTLPAGLLISAGTFLVSVKLGLAFVLNLFLITVASNTIKYFYFKPRPENPEGKRPTIPFHPLDVRYYLKREGIKNFIAAFKFIDSGSFPSVHSARSMNQALLFALLLFQGNPVIQGLLISFAFLIGISRVVKYKHYPTDVAAGFLIGAVFAGITYAIW